MRIITVILLVSLSLLGCGEKNSKEQQATLKSMGVYQFDEPRTISPVTFENVNGGKVSIGSPSRAWQIVNFGYMTCPDVCSINLSLLDDIDQRWRKASDIPLTISFVTFDPERDTTEKLSEYLNYLNKNFVGLRSNHDATLSLATQLLVVYNIQKPDERGHYFVDHSDNMAIMNPEGQFVAVTKAPYDIDNLIEAIALMSGD